jgi:hypothetical protein
MRYRATLVLRPLQALLGIEGALEHVVGRPDLTRLVIHALMLNVNITDQFARMALLVGKDQGVDIGRTFIHCLETAGETLSLCLGVGMGLLGGKIVLLGLLPLQGDKLLQIGFTTGHLTTCACAHAPQS